ncbi:hypothetical protein ACFL3E_01135 [Patescibacteria group bacterium]
MDKDINPIKRKIDPASGKVVMSDVVKKAPAPNKVVPEPEIIRPKTKIVSAPSFIQANKQPRFFKGKFIFWSSAAIFLLVVFLWGVNKFATMKIVVVPKISAFELSQPVSLRLSYDTINATQSKEREFVSTTRKMISKRANGIITVYNAFSSEPQTLIPTTRFETPDGKIYRISQSAHIPGAKVEEGKIIPSSMEVRVFADKPGENYNIGLTDFTIPGFEGGPKYTKFTAQSKTQMKDGYQGEVMVVGDAEADKALQILQKELADELGKSFEESTPEGFFIPEGGKSINILSSSVEPEQGSIADLFHGQVSIETTAVVFNIEEFSRAVADQLFDTFPFGQNVPIVILTGDNSLEIDIQSAEDGMADLSLSGNVEVVWLPNKDHIANQIVLSGVASIEGVLSGYESIESAEVFFTPSWWKRIPSQPDDLMIVVESQ